MRLWLLRVKDANQDKMPWGKNRAVVVRASSEERARELADKEAEAEGRIWKTAAVSCELLTEFGDEEIILIDHRHE